jgi:hypothetical protein
VPFPITKGLGSMGDSSLSALLTTSGYGEPGSGGNPCNIFNLVTVNVFQTDLDLLFSTNIQLSPYAANPANWSIESLGSGVAMNVTAVSYSGPTIHLTVTEGTDGQLYKLNIPTVGITDTTMALDPYPGPYTQNFYAVASGPVISLAYAPDGLQVQVIFNVPVVVSEALVAANYVITGGAGLTVFSVTQETANSYLLATSLQIPGFSYTLTVSNIHDIYGNPI